MPPKNAKKVFKGVLFDVYQWRQKMFDGTYQTFEAVKRKPSVQIIVTVGDKLVLNHEEQSYVGKFTSLPGGWMDEKNPENTVKRELLEELGMKPQNIELFMTGTFSYKIFWDTYYYIARDCKKVKEQTLDPGEKINPFLVTFEEFVEITSEETFRNKEFSNFMFRLKQDPKKLKEFKKLIFKKEIH